MGYDSVIGSLSEQPKRLLSKLRLALLGNESPPQYRRKLTLRNQVSKDNSPSTHKKPNSKFTSNSEKCIHTLSGADVKLHLLQKDVNHLLYFILNSPSLCQDINQSEISSESVDQLDLQNIFLRRISLPQNSADLTSLKAPSSSTSLVPPPKCPQNSLEDDVNLGLELYDQLAQKLPALYAQLSNVHILPYGSLLKEEFFTHPVAGIFDSHFLYVPDDSLLKLYPDSNYSLCETTSSTNSLILPSYRPTQSLSSLHKSSSGPAQTGSLKGKKGPYEASDREMDLEDTSDDAYERRHRKMELIERKEKKQDLLNQMRNMRRSCSQTNFQPGAEEFPNHCFPNSQIPSIIFSDSVVGDCWCQNCVSNESFQTQIRKEDFGIGLEASKVSPPFLRNLKAIEITDKIPVYAFGLPFPVSIFSFPETEFSPSF